MIEDALVKAVHDGEAVRRGEIDPRLPARIGKAKFGGFNGFQRHRDGLLKGRVARMICPDSETVNIGAAALPRISEMAGDFMGIRRDCSTVVRRRGAWGSRWIAGTPYLQALSVVEGNQNF